MRPKVITINRQYGSNGRIIGRVLADRLGVHFYDKDLLHLVQVNCGIPYEELIKVDEKAASKWRYPVEDAYQMQGKYHYEPMNDVLFKAESELIVNLADKEPCIIIGRCSNYLLRDMKNHLSIFIYAPYEERIKTVMERSDIGYKDAESLVKKIDKERKYYYNYHTDERWEDMRQYDLCIDSSRMTIEKIVDMIAAAVVK